ncbi:DUF5682 family protein [Corynebacterium mendelii]|uniref:VWA domain-containing protein n=1 Tax=Corynebacterium mendelii TaxID=2765362 RepID=A0A939ISV9_9CORY|nr:DUF5682 family protein [Corynebacterium mendelii]MBN9643189.1 VWA domain-containing protein [Corynebacterium mendelii]
MACPHPFHAAGGPAAAASFGNDGDWTDLLEQMTDTGGDSVLFGIRHHSPACARAVVQAAEHLCPRAVAVEMPSDLADYVTWLVHPDTRAPVAVAAATDGGAGGFYPFADFSPELAICRWAHANRVPVEFIDLPVGLRHAVDTDPDASAASTDAGKQSTSCAAAGFSSLIGQEAWDTSVEAPSVGCTWQQIRRAALAVGIAARYAETHDGTPADAVTRAREAWMARRLQQLTGTSATPSSAGPVLVVVGAYHCAALVPGGCGDTAPGREEELFSLVPQPVTVSVVRYSFERLDTRSGYASGIRDPHYHQELLTRIAAAGDDQKAQAAAAQEVAGDILTDIARGLRKEGEPAGTGEVAEAFRFARDLAQLRGLPAPGRREILDAATTVMAQSQVTGRGRLVARAVAAAMAGDRVGDLPADCPVAELQKHTRGQLAALSLPSTEQQPRASKKIAPFSGPTDLKRHLILARLKALDVPYWEGGSGTTRGMDNRSYTIDCRFTPMTAAELDRHAAAGVTLEQAADTVLVSRLNRAAGSPEGPDPEVVTGIVDRAAACAAPQALSQAIDLLEQEIAVQLGFRAAVSAMQVLAGIAGGRQPAAACLPEQLLQRCDRMVDELARTVVGAIDGVKGSAKIADARLLGTLAGLSGRLGLAVGHALADVIATGSALMAGAACAVDSLLEERDAPAFEDRADTTGTGSPSGTGAGGHGVQTGRWDALCTRTGALVDRLAVAETRVAARDWLTGFLAALGPVWSDHPGLDGLIARVSGISDGAFIAALPGLRAVFDTVAPGERERFLDRLAQDIGRIDQPEIAPEILIATATADQEAKKRLEALGLLDLSFDPSTRWRLVLGADPEQLSGTGWQMAETLDELYGGTGDDRTGEAQGRVRAAGSGPGSLAVRRWKNQIEVLFGPDRVDDILGVAAERGRADAALELNAETARPSVGLLTTLLNLKGALPESTVARIRPLIARVVDELARALATTMRPALTGIGSARRSLRPAGRLDLPATIRKNLSHVVSIDGRVQIVPVNPVFCTPVKQSSEWHIIVAVDVSGSMEASTVYAAMTAAILSAVDCLRVELFTFDTDIIDMTGTVDDPLATLLEIKVGGGTDIAKAMAYALSRVTVPAKTMVVLVTDFEESGSAHRLVGTIREMTERGITTIGCAALDDTGLAAHNAGVAQLCAGAGMHTASLSPLALGRWIAQVVNR